jgi:hypothetical protein
LLQLVRELWAFDPPLPGEPPQDGAAPEPGSTRGRKRRPGSREERDGGAAP